MESMYKCKHTAPHQCIITSLLDFTEIFDFFGLWADIILGKHLLCEKLTLKKAALIILLCQIMYKMRPNVGAVCNFPINT